MEVWLFLMLASILGPVYGLSPQDVPHSRQKRILWITNDGRLALPPGTTLVVTPSIAMPFIRHPPQGFFSNITISLPFTIDFDKLGLTDNENPYGDLPFIFSRSFGRTAGNLFADFIASYMDKRRGKRSAEENKIPPQIEQKLYDFFHGGERALLYGALEDMLTNFGLSGKPCLLRAICEVHAHPLKNFGLFGETLKLFFTASKSPYSELLQEYVDAENAGVGDSEGPGECWPYYKDCPKSLFLPGQNKYTKDAERLHQEELAEEELSHMKVTEIDMNKIKEFNMRAM